MNLTLQAASIRADDYSTIGAVIFAVLTPAILWKRANAIDRKSTLPMTLFLASTDCFSGLGWRCHWIRYWCHYPLRQVNRRRSSTQGRSIRPEDKVIT